MASDIVGACTIPRTDTDPATTQGQESDFGDANGNNKFNVFVRYDKC